MNGRFSSLMRKGGINSREDILRELNGCCNLQIFRDSVQFDFLITVRTFTDLTKIVNWYCDTLFAVGTDNDNIFDHTTSIDGFR
jgi:hypothetical protein